MSAPDGITRRVNAKGLYTLKQVAPMVGRDVTTVQRWIRNGQVSEPKYMNFGELDIPVFSPQDVVRLREESEDIRPGRPRKIGLKPAGRLQGTMRMVSLSSYTTPNPEEDGNANRR